MFGVTIATASLMRAFTGVTARHVADFNEFLLVKTASFNCINSLVLTYTAVLSRFVIL
jgi:hypothetical protein